MARTLNDVERENPNASVSLISKLIEYRADDNSLRRTRVQDQVDNNRTISIPSGEPTGSTQNTATTATETSVTDPNKVNGTIPPSSTNTNANVLNEKFLKPGEEPSGSYKITMNDYGPYAKTAEKNGYVFNKEYTHIKCSGDNPNTVTNQRKRARILADQVKYTPEMFFDDAMTDDRKSLYGKYIKGQFNSSNEKSEYEYIGDDVCPVDEEKKQPAPESSKPTAVVIKQDVEKKEEVKEKQAESPQTAPAVVDTSNALTEDKAKEIQQSAFQSTAKGEGWFVFDYMESTDNTKKMIDNDALTYDKRFWLVRRKPSHPTKDAAKQEKDLSVGPVLGSVQYYVGMNQKKLEAGAPIAGGAQSILDIPLLLNFPSVGVYNKAIPYMASGAGGRWPTEQLGIIHEGRLPASWYNKGGWAIGKGTNPSPTGGPKSSWNENQWWCGAGSEYYTENGGYSMPHGDPTGVPTITAVAMKRAATATKSAFPDKKYVSGKTINNGFVQYPVAWDNTLKSNVVLGPYHLDNNQKDNAYSSSWLMQNRTTPTPIIQPWFTPGPVYGSSLNYGGSVAVFVRGFHFANGSLTAQGKTLWSTITTALDWDVAFVYNLHHVETVIWASPYSATGEAIVMAGNTSPSFTPGKLDDGFTNDGGSFAVRKIQIFTAASFAGRENGTVIISKLTHKTSKKISKGLGAKYKSTPMIKDYIAKVEAGSDKNLMGKRQPEGLSTPTYYQVLKEICQI